MKVLRESKRKRKFEGLFSELVSEVAQCHFDHILVSRGDHKVLARFQRKKNRFCLLMGGARFWKTIWEMFTPGDFR